MAVELGTPVANALQNLLQAKLEEAGWSSGGDDTGLAEYILLLVVNGKTQEEIAQEVSAFDLEGANDQSTRDFARWLLQQVQSLNAPPSTQVRPAEVSGENTQPQSQQLLSSAVSKGETFDDNAQDAAMDDAEIQHDGAIPTGPKSMRPGQPKNRNQKILGQLNSAMDRQHRIKGTAGTGRIGKDPPKGPTPRGPKALANGMQRMQQRQMNTMPMPQQSHMAGMQNQPPFANMTPEAQFQASGMFEQMAQWMAMMQNGVSPTNIPQQAGKSLFDRVHKNGNRRKQHQKSNFSHADVAMDPSSSMEVESGNLDPSTTVCKYNLFCTKADCPFVHQSPAAPPETAIDMNDICSFGAACKSVKCVGKHPSPAKKLAHNATQDCKFFPNCTNQRCPFNHPTTPICRNGADCSVEGCKFVHSQIACKFNPCMNPMCKFKHVEGQKRGKFTDHVWIKGDQEDSENGQHVSDRKFIDEGAEEELILPGQDGIKAEPTGIEGEGMVT